MSNEPKKEIDTLNKFLVSCAMPGRTVIMNTEAARKPLNREDAMNLAAWLLAVSAASDEEFAVVLDAVRES